MILAIACYDDLVSARLILLARIWCMASSLIGMITSLLRLATGLCAFAMGILAFT